MGDLGVCEGLSTVQWPRSEFDIRLNFGWLCQMPLITSELMNFIFMCY